MVSSGLAEGPLEGDAVGVAEGELEGAELIEPDGLELGAGLTVGLAVGALLG